MSQILNLNATLVMYIHKLPDSPDPRLGRDMNRRTFVKGLVAGAVTGFQVPFANGADYDGKLFVFVQAKGGWDPTSFCDPKANTPGEKVINHWAETGEIRQAGNLFYGDFANNEKFFDKYHDRMLVINGVDAQTNSHTTGVVHNWSGRSSEGYPSLTALLAAHHGPALSLAYLSFGGFAVTAGLTPFTRLHGADLIRNIATPELPESRDDGKYFFPGNWETISKFRDANIARLAAAPQLLPRAARNRRLYRAAISREATEGLKAYGALIPPEDELEPGEEGPRGTFGSGLRRQAQLAVLAFKARVAVSADLHLDGFDTHAQHDPIHEWLLANLTDSVDYLWEYAETHGVADRLVVVMGSDFGRTNHYNVDEGKDHWPIGSVVVMEKNQPWTNRVIGETDALHFAHKINPKTLQRDDANGTIIHPKHVHKALRRYLGVENSLGAQRFPFHNTDDFAFFD